jgi:hypothetical protein
MASGQAPTSRSFSCQGDSSRTEIESFQRIVHVGTWSSGESHFYVDHGNGLRSYFGVTENSRVNDPGDWTRTWYISRTVDQFGNEIEYDYESTSAHETLPKEIVWTRNTGQSLAPRYKVAITYEDRPADDQRSGYDGAGAQWSRTKRIEQIDVNFDGGQGVQNVAS